MSDETTNPATATGLGTLYWQQDQPVRLRMLWPRPLHLDAQEFIDWA